MSALSPRVAALLEHLLVPGDPSQREGFLGGTDAAALVCARDGAPYFSGAGEWKTWASQKHPELIAPPSDEAQARWDLGHHLEPYVVERFVREANDDLADGGTGYVYAPEPFQWMRVQIDSLVFQGDRTVGPLDAKATEIPWEWYGWERQDGEWQSTETLSAGYQVQGQMQLGVLRMRCAALGLPLPEIAIYAGLDLENAPMVPDGPGRVRLDLDRAPLMVREIEHDEARWRDIFWYVVRWWERHILGDEEPPDDDMECCQRWRLHEQARGLGERQATADELVLIAEWRAAKATRKQAEEDRKTLQARIAATMDVPRLKCGGKAKVQIQRTGTGIALMDHGF